MSSANSVQYKSNEAGINATACCFFFMVPFSEQKMTFFSKSSKKILNICIFLTESETQNMF